MKVIVLFLVSLLVGASASAALPSETGSRGASDACALSWTNTTTVRSALRALSRRFYLASLEAVEDPEQFVQVRRAVATDARYLYDRYGAACVLKLDETRILSAPLILGRD